jgi:chromosome partitioning protein
MVIIDTRPSKGPLVQAAMYAATHLLIPSEMEAPSVEGLHGMLSVRSQANLQRAKGDHLELVGVLPNKVRAGTRIHEEFLGLLREDPQIGPVMLSGALNDWVGYKESMVFGAPSIFEGRKSDRLRRQLEEVCREVIEKMGVTGGSS